MLFTVRAALRMNIDMVEGRSENNRQRDGWIDRWLMHCKH
jgi:hypothetical protein